MLRKGVPGLAGLLLMLCSACGHAAQRRTAALPDSDLLGVYIAAINNAAGQPRGDRNAAIVLRQETAAMSPEGLDLLFDNFPMQTDGVDPSLFANARTRFSESVSLQPLLAMLKAGVGAELRPVGVAEFERLAGEAGLVSVTQVAFSDSHRAALVSYGISCGGTCGRQVVALLTRGNPGWRIVAWVVWGQS